MACLYFCEYMLVCECVCISFYASVKSFKLTITDVLVPLKTGSLSGQSIDLSLTLDMTDAAHT